LTHSTVNTDVEPAKRGYFSREKFAAQASGLNFLHE
jgi:hypothetical protein